MIRPANVVTAIADVLAGFAVAISFFIDLEPIQYSQLFFLILATVSFYSSGIVFNDIADQTFDSIHRPERVLPSKQLSVNKAKKFGLILILLGVFFCYLVSFQAIFIGLLITAFSMLYNFFAKNDRFFGSLTMGICRGLNLMLGMSFLDFYLFSPALLLCFIPVIFIFGITLTSKEELSANNKFEIFVAFCIDLMILLVLLFVIVLKQSVWMEVLPFIFIWFLMNAFPKIFAIFKNHPDNILLL